MLAVDAAASNWSGFLKIGVHAGVLALPGGGDRSRTARANSDSEEGQGESPASHQPSRRHRSAAPPHDAVPADVFIVDDEEGICELLALALQPLGVKAARFQSAEDAIAALERGQPDIVFLDISLKGSDAIDVIRALGRMHFGGGVQLMSGRSALLLEDVRRIGARHGLYMRPPLEKPFRADAVRQAVISAPFDGQTVTTLSLAPTTRIEIGEALDQGWLELWYQPKVDLRRGHWSASKASSAAGIRCTGCSTPLRSCPAENTESDTTALREHQVITALRDWNELNAAGTPLRTAVNTSISALGSVKLPALVREYRPKSERWPGLILELTEDEVVKDLDLVHEISTQLRISGNHAVDRRFRRGILLLRSHARAAVQRVQARRRLRRRMRGGHEQRRDLSGDHRPSPSFRRRLRRRRPGEPGRPGAIRDMGCHLGQGPVLAEPMPKVAFLAGCANGRGPASLVLTRSASLVMPLTLAELQERGQA